MTVSQAARSSSTPLLGRGAAARALEAERRRHDADGERAELARDARDDRCGAGARAAALARSHEDHVGAAERGAQLIHRLLGGRPADGRIGAGAEAVRELLSDRDLRRRVRDGERLPVGVHGDEVHLRDPRVHHAVDRVQPGAAHPDDADRGDVGGALRRRHAVELRRRLEHRLEVARGGARSGGLGRDAPPPARDGRRGSRLDGAGSAARARLGLRAKSGTCSTVSSSAASARGSTAAAGSGSRGGLLRALRRLGLAEELRERALTHRRALARHRAPPSRGRGRPVPPARTGRI